MEHSEYTPYSFSFYTPRSHTWLAWFGRAVVSVQPCSDKLLSRRTASLRSLGPQLREETEAVSTSVLPIIGHLRTLLNVIHRTLAACSILSLEKPPGVCHNNGCKIRRTKGHPGPWRPPKPLVQEVVLRDIAWHSKTTSQSESLIICL